MDSNLLYIETANSLEEQIQEGVFREGDKLPSERELTTVFQVSRKSYSNYWSYWEGLKGVIL